MNRSIIEHAKLIRLTRREKEELKRYRENVEVVMYELFEAIRNGFEDDVYTKWLDLARFVTKHYREDFENATSQFFDVVEHYCSKYNLKEVEYNYFIKSPETPYFTIYMK